MSKEDYETIRKEREHLKVLLTNGGPERLVKPIENRLKEIRENLKNEHRNRQQ